MKEKDVVDEIKVCYMARKTRYRALKGHATKAFKGNQKPNKIHYDFI